jgi:hypothetical protein
MSAAVRLGGFAAMLAAAFAAAALAGGALAGEDDAAGEPEPPAAAHGHGEEAGADEPGAAEAGAAHDAAAGRAGDGGAGPAGGLAVAERGFRLELARTSLPAREGAPLRFRITGRDGEALRRGFDVEHARELHLIVVRRDTVNFQHLHPRRGADGTWSTRVDLSEPGAYRVFADFRHRGEKLTLGADLFAGGGFRPRALPDPSPLAAADGFDVELPAPELSAGRETTLRFAVSRDGAPFDALQPYLGARGHLVALREGDLAYLHVHPIEDEGHEHTDGSTDAEPHANEVSFAATFPTPGRYRLFLEFKAEDEVHRVAYTVEVPR